MASQQPSVEELLKLLERHHEQSLGSLRRLHETLGNQRKRERSNTQVTISDADLPLPQRALSGPVFSRDSPSIQAIPVPSPSSHRAGLDAPERPWAYPSPGPAPSIANRSDIDYPAHDEDLTFIPLLDSQPAASQNPPATTPADETPRVTRPLAPLKIADRDLLIHLRDSEFWGDTAQLLEDVLRRRGDIDLSVPFADFAAYEREGYVSSTLEVYDVAADASARKTSVDVDVQGVVKKAGDGPYETQDEIVDAPMVWESIKEVNSDGQSVGRITIVQEPTPLIVAALHLSMSPNFDMSEIIHHFMSDIPNRGRTHACMHRAFERDPYPPSAPIPEAALSFGHLRQRSFFFAFKYYTVVGQDLEPAPWQRFDKRNNDGSTDDHINISECGSILALSLEGEPTKPLRIRPRRERMREGFLFDTFGPWHLLSIQSFPDDEHTVREEEFQHKSFYNGPYAFLDLLVAEYRDAGKRNQVLHERITKLITPPTEFMFDRRLRDKLLFEDKHFTYIRRYFWAYNTLAVINAGIKAMVSSYVDTFTDEFWAGTHPLIWPVPSTMAPDAAAAYRDKMAVLRRELDKVVSELGEVLKRNERTRQEIENLRDQLFSGSSIKESRRAVDQGDNIRILTMISMIFLPLTFVTSVFGITEFTIPADDWRFALTMVLVCVPFMSIVLLLQTRLFTLLRRRISARATQLVLFLRGLVTEAASEPSPDNWSTMPAAARKPMGRKRRLMQAEGSRGRDSWSGWFGSKDKDAPKV